MSLVYHFLEHGVVLVGTKREKIDKVMLAIKTCETTSCLCTRLMLVRQTDIL